MRSFILAMLAFLTLAPALPAHPVPKDNRDRTLVVRLTPTAVVVEYRLEADESIAATELPEDEKKGITTRSQLHEVLSRFLSEVVGENLVGQLDGARLRFRCARRIYVVTDHMRLDFRFEAPWTPARSFEHTFRFTESNWDLDDFSKLSVHLTCDPGLTVLSSVGPSEELIARAGFERKSGDGNKLRRLEAIFRVESAVLPAAYKPALPPDLLPPRAGPEDTSESSISAALVKSPPGETAAFDKPYRQDQAPTGEAPLPAAHNLLTLLLDSRWGVGMLLLLAGLFGAAHALTPGHGKTLVAAYLIGERGTVWHALILGVVVTVTHTFAVLLLAALLPVFFPKAVPASVQTSLGLIGGLLIAGLGIWLLLRRLAGQADHVHIGGGHHHQPVALPAADQPMHWWGLVVLGISGGIVPCWDAIAMLGFAISAQRLWLGVPLLLAFSAGLAGVLILIGIGVVYARNLAGDWWGGQGKRFGPVVRALPLVSAILVTVLGMWLCYDSVHGGMSGH